MKNTMPRTPFSTPLSGSAKEAELRLKNIFSGPKKRPPLPLLILMFAVCLLCGNLVSCHTRSGTALADASPAVLRSGTDYILDRVQAFLFRTQTVPLGEWRGRALSLELEEHQTEWQFSFQVDRINVLLDGERIQTITAPETMPNGVERLPDGVGTPYQEDWSEWDCYGLFDYSLEFEAGSPIVLDLNFDGHMDFGLLSFDTYSRNLPYIFYLWDPEREQFDCFGTFNYTLEADPESQQLIEVDYGGNEGDDTNWYAWEDGRLVLVRREEEDYWTYYDDEPVWRDEAWYNKLNVHIYERENGQMVQKEDEIRYYYAG